MDIDAMSLGELSVAIAERLGWHWIRCKQSARDDDTEYRWLVPPDSYKRFPAADGSEPTCLGSTYNLPKWTKDIAAADKLLDDLDEQGLSHSVHGSANEIECVVYGNDVWDYDSRAESATGQTRPEAISRAWLKATGIGS